MSKLIYVADDESNIRELLKRFLENAGYEVETFENGDCCKRNSIFVIVHGVDNCSALSEKCG